MSLDVLTALFRNATNTCMVGRDIDLDGQHAEPCKAWAINLVNISTDNGELHVHLCDEHKAQLQGLTSAEQITELVS